MTSPLPFPLSEDKPVLIAGPTASGKSSLALAIAAQSGRRIVNADALQVFDGWRLLTARPSAADERLVPHVLYGHVPYHAEYSVGHWLREVAPLLSERPAPVIVGGTGLYFSALTEGLAAIPPISPETRTLATQRMDDAGIDAMRADLDPDTRNRIDLCNPVRVQRAWEVLTETGRGLAAWQDDPAPPLLRPEAAHLFQLAAEKDWLTPRINRRFDGMIAAGALDEARAMAQDWDPTRLSSRAIGAAQLIAVLRGTMTESDAIAAAKIASHQYAKRQRTWFRRRMRQWSIVDAAVIGGSPPEQ
nr:tRNA (adenosine(37)-N6)-dimethylallyltransferase MiaA [Pseudoruegeria sp. SK021]